MKKCTKCQIEKELDQYHKDKQKKDGYCPICKECQKLYHLNYDLIHKDNKSKHSKQHYINNKNNVLNKSKLYYELVKEKSDFKINRQIYSKIYNKNNRDKINSYTRDKMKNDSSFYLSKCLRDRLYQFLKEGGYRKYKKTQDVLGCTWNEFKIWIESHFLEGMSWENRGRGYNKWNIDHGIPLQWAKNDDEIYKLSHYTNLKPMWGKDNIQKSNSYGEIWDGINWNKITKQDYENILFNKY